MGHRPEIAIVEANTLTALGLKAILEEIIPAATIRVFRQFAELTDDTPDMYVHYFVSAQIYMEHAAFFLSRRRKTIVLAGNGPSAQLADIQALNVCAPERELVREILKLHQRAHHSGYPGETASPSPAAVEERETLTAREAEVLALVAKGLLNKEVADRLGIGLTTVISHRKRITEKLGIKSVSGLTIYAVMNGYVEADEI